MDTNSISAWAALASAVAAAVSAVATFLAMRPTYLAIENTTWIEIRNKRMDVLIHCIKRYEDLTSNRQPFEEDGPLTPVEESYFRRLWAIKREQIDFWIDGFVAPEALIDWFMGDVDYFSGRNASVPEIRYRQGWDFVKTKHSFISDEFMKIIDHIADEICCVEHKENRSRQKALLFCHFQDLEMKEAAKIRRRRADGTGRLWFRDLREELSPHQQEIVDAECARMILETGAPQTIEFDLYFRGEAMWLGRGVRVSDLNS